MDPPMLRLEKKERRNYEMKTTVRYVYLSTLSLYRISRIMSSILLDFFRQKCYNFNFIYAHHQRLPPRHFVTMFAASNTRQKQGVTTRHTRRRYAAQSVTPTPSTGAASRPPRHMLCFQSTRFQPIFMQAVTAFHPVLERQELRSPCPGSAPQGKTKKGIRGGDAASQRPA